MKLLTRCVTPLSSNYHPSEDTTSELDASGVIYYQELKRVLIWAVELGIVGILLEVSLLNTHLNLPHAVHLQHAYDIFRYLKKYPRRRVFMDLDHLHIDKSIFKKFDWVDIYINAEESIPLDMMKLRSNLMSTHCVVNGNHSVYKVTRRSQTGILFFCKKAPVIWKSKRQKGVNISTFGSEFIALKNYMKLIKALR